MLDEPDAHLDDETADGAPPELLQTARAAGVGVLLISHRPAACALADRVLELDGGRIGAAPGAPVSP